MDRQTKCKGATRIIESGEEEIEANKERRKSRQPIWCINEGSCNVIKGKQRRVEKLFASQPKQPKK